MSRMLLWHVMALLAMLAGATHADDVGDSTSTTTVTSTTSPAWFEAAMGASGALPAVTVDGDPAAVTPSANGWFASNSVAGAPVGIALNAGNPVSVSVTDGDATTTTQVAWSPIDFASMPYGLEDLVVRPGDAVLVTASNGSPFSIDVGRGGYTQTIPCDAGSRHPVSFAEPGQYRVRVRTDDAVLGELTLDVVQVDLRGPIACQIGYTRLKDVGVANADPSAVSFCASSADLSVGTDSSQPDGWRLWMRPNNNAPSWLEARLGSTSGPIVVRQRIDAFTIVTSAQHEIGILQTYDDGTRRLGAFLTMHPLVAALDVRMHAFISGVTFDDSQVDREVSSDAFYRETNGDGTYRYEMLMAVDAGYTRSCHTLGVWQNGVQISF